MITLTVKFPDNTQETMHLIYVKCVEDILLSLRNGGYLTTPNSQIEIENHFGKGYIIITDILCGEEICKVEW